MGKKFPDSRTLDERARAEGLSVEYINWISCVLGKSIDCGRCGTSVPFDYDFDEFLREHKGCEEPPLIG